MKFLSLPVMAFVLMIAGCTNNDSNSTPSETGTENTTPALTYSIVAAYPHDTSSYTEGLLFYKGELYESTGNYGPSKLLQLDLKTGRPVKQVKLDAQYFGEGITILHDTVYQLTWKEKKVFLYNAQDFKKIGELPLSIEGWGLTTDGTNLIATDGSSNLNYFEPGTFRLLRTQGVTENGSPVVNLNEVEYINGFIYANQYQYNYIVKIDPSSGQVVGKMDLTDVVNRVKAKDPHVDVLNGIAYDSVSKKIFITGKWWPEMYEIQFPH